MILTNLKDYHERTQQQLKALKLNMYGTNCQPSLSKSCHPIEQSLTQRNHKLILHTATKLHEMSCYHIQSN